MPCDLNVREETFPFVASDRLDLLQIVDQAVGEGVNRLQAVGDGQGKGLIVVQRVGQLNRSDLNEESPFDLRVRKTFDRRRKEGEFTEAFGTSPSIGRKRSSGKGFAEAV